MIEKQNERRSAVLLDWQFACVGSPLTDVCFFLVSSLDPDVRKRYNTEVRLSCNTYA